MASATGAPGRAHASSRVLTLLATLALMISSCSSGGGTSSDGGDAPLTPAQQQLYDQAIADGGQLRVFIGTSDKDALDALGAAFEEQFADVAIEFIYGTSDHVLERFLSEKRAGLNNADVIALAGMIAFPDLNQEGYLADFTPSEAALFGDDPGTVIPGRAYGTSTINFGVCYNADKLSDEEVALLQTYQGWADPRWHGRAAIARPDGFGYRRGMIYWAYGDPALGEPWLQRIADLDPIVFPNANAASSQVTAGEYDILYNAPTAIQAVAIRDGAPFRCTTGEYGPAYPFVAALPNDAPNAAAGQLFIEWMMSESGQRAVQKTLGYTALREGFDEPVFGEGAASEPPDDQRIVTDELVQSRQAEFAALFDRLFVG